MSHKIMVSAAASWNGVTKPFFVNPALTKVTGAYYRKPPDKANVTSLQKMYPANDFYYIHDEAGSHISKRVQLLERGSQTSLRYQGPMATLLSRPKSA